MPKRRVGKNVIEVLEFCRNCGKKNPPNRPVFCSRQCSKEYYLKPEARKKYQGGDDDGFRKRSVECICPRCGTTHKKWMLWTGRGKPRKFCWDCYELANSIDAEAA